MDWYIQGAFTCVFPSREEVSVHVGKGEGEGEGGGGK